MRKASRLGEFCATAHFTLLSCFLLIHAQLVAAPPDLTGKWTLAKGFSNIGVSNIPVVAIEDVSQTEADVTIDRTRDGQTTKIHVILNGQPAALDGATSVRAFWRADSLVIVYTQLGGGSSVQEQFSLIKNGAVLWIYRKGPQGARLSLYMSRQ